MARSGTIIKHSTKCGPGEVRAAGVLHPLPKLTSSFDHSFVLLHIGAEIFGFVFIVSVFSLSYFLYGKKINT